MDAAPSPEGMNILRKADNGIILGGCLRYAAAKTVVGQVVSRPDRNSQACWDLLSGDCRSGRASHPGRRVPGAHGSETRVR